MNNNDFKFFKELDIRWSDFDAIGHVNNVMYFEYFQIGRGFYFPNISKNWDWSKNMFVIAHIEADYKKELKPSAKSPKIGLRISQIGNKSFDLEYIITSKSSTNEDIIHCTGKSTQVMIDLKEKKSIEIPEWLRKDFENSNINL